MIYNSRGIWTRGPSIVKSWILVGGKRDIEEYGV